MSRNHVSAILLLVFIMMVIPYASATTVGIDLAHGENPNCLVPVVYKNQTYQLDLIFYELLTGKLKKAIQVTTDRSEVQRLVRKLVEGLGRNAVLSAKLNDKAGLISALEELKEFTREERGEVERAIETVELLLMEGLPISPELVERVEVLVDRIKREVEG
ncbi:hypothetical protein TEU_08210 [Thermococcus eurythermalis]|uniref:DUF5667 domain-containing protein n=1 Tax=Thermococcus eurythermalis TaxID=1505907 RepID=A0A097QV10_9EURY|nr:hypothetical protein [Thermococcus eurythermalis]AIU70314.1 hypothetical protein TEU_08210 [Thermococcus eurythermalis]